MSMTLSSLGNDIHNYRIEAGLSHEQLSSISGINRKWSCDWCYF